MAEVAQRYSASVSFDWRLYPHDIAGSIAHAAALPPPALFLPTNARRSTMDCGRSRGRSKMENFSGTNRSKMST